MEHEPEVVLYTDGACSGNPGPGGWACILSHAPTRSIKKLADSVEDTTNNRMELTAVIEGLRTLKKPTRVKVVSDSEYVVKGMSAWVGQWIRNGWMRGRRKNEPVKNADLWKELVELCAQHEVDFEHVRGHAGHPANEECDRMATAAIKRFREDAR
ncbi:MAG: ribonuclease HI [bacterium]|nr:ribonuclease HI [bacterium]